MQHVIKKNCQRKHKITCPKKRGHRKILNIIITQFIITKLYSNLKCRIDVHLEIRNAIFSNNSHLELRVRLSDSFEMGLTKRP